VIPGYRDGMDDVPPPEAFEPQPDEPVRPGRGRRRLQAAIAVVVILALIGLAAVENGGLIVRPDIVEGPAAIPTLAMVDGSGALMTVDGNGRSVVPYPVPDVTFQFPAASPDGLRIAAIGQGTDGTGVYVFRKREPGGDTTDPAVVYTSVDRPPFYLYWSPDGSTLTFLTTEPDGLALRVVPADGSGDAAIVRSGSPMYWDFVDPARLLVHSGVGPPDGFFGEVGVDGAPVAGTDRATGVFRAPAVSGDGRFRAYLAPGDGGIGEVVRESRDGSGTTRIRVFGPGAVGFSPTGDELAFVAPDQLTSSQLPLPIGPLRILDSGAAEARTLMAGSVVAFFWSPTGKTIAVLQLPDTDEPGTEVVARQSATQETAAGISLRLSFVGVDDGSTRPDRLVRVSDLFVNQVLPFFDQYALSHRFWAPDGSALVLPIVDDADVTRLYAIPPDGSDAHVIATGEIGFWSP
jgi:TolB protein